MSTKRKFLVIGGSYMNLQMKINPKTKADATTTGTDYCFHPYGDSAIVAISAAKNGGSCLFSTRFGDDINGKRLYEYYKNCGISKQLMRKDKHSQTGLCLTLFSNRFEHEHFLSKGASMRFTKNEIDEALASSPDLFLAPLEELGYEEHLIIMPAKQIPEQALDEDISQSLMPKVMIETSEFPVIPFEDEPSVGEFSTGYDFLEENGASADEPKTVQKTAQKKEAEQPVYDEEGVRLREPRPTALKAPTDASVKAQEESPAPVPAEENAAPISQETIISCETISSYIEKESLALYSVKQAEEKGIPMLVQYTSFTAQYPLESMKNIKFFVVSDEDLFHLTGFFPDNTEKTLRAIIAISEKIQAKYYIVQRGDDGVFVYDGKRYELVFAPESLRRDTRELGFKMKPTFIGALASEYLETKNIIHSCHLATIVSLLTRTKFGNLEKLMTREELIRYTTEHGIHLFKS